MSPSHSFRHSISPSLGQREWLRNPLCDFFRKMKVHRGPTYKMMARKKLQITLIFFYFLAIAFAFQNVKTLIRPIWDNFRSFLPFSIFSLSLSLPLPSFLPCLFVYLFVCLFICSFFLSFSLPPFLSSFLPSLFVYFLLSFISLYIFFVLSFILSFHHQFLIQDCSHLVKVTGLFSSVHSYTP